MINLPWQQRSAAHVHSWFKKETRERVHVSDPRGHRNYREQQQNQQKMTTRGPRDATTSHTRCRILNQCNIHPSTRPSGRPSIHPFIHSHCRHACTDARTHASAVLTASQSGPCKRSPPGKCTGGESNASRWLLKKCTSDVCARARARVCVCVCVCVWTGPSHALHFDVRKPSSGESRKARQAHAGSWLGVSSVGASTAKQSVA